MVIKIVQSGSSKKPKTPKIEREVDPEWEHWMTESAYSREDARRELQLANGTFYRRIAKPPTHCDRLAMAALYEGITPFKGVS